jgi:hypothetical protein
MCITNLKITQLNLLYKLALVGLLSTMGRIVANPDKTDVCGKYFSAYLGGELFMTSGLITEQRGFNNN